VSANPTAKLCGEIVREAMRKEYASGGVSWDVQALEFGLKAGLLGLDV
jgi:hypothetical protein